MARRGDGRYSANHVMASIILACAAAVILCGKSLWVPASRIDNLHGRAIALAAAEALSALADATSADVFIPALREAFLDASGLAEHSLWDTRYFNRHDPSRVRDALPRSTETLGDSALANAPIDASSPVSTGASDPEASPDHAANSKAATASRPASSTGGRRALIHSRESPLEVYFFGDSQVFSLGSGFSRLVGKEGPINVDVVAIHSSGFIRSDYYDWPTKLSDALSSQPYDAAVMMLGMNDYQNFWSDEGVALKKRTKAWEDAYKARCRALIDVALSSVPRLYWIGMPMVKNEAYNSSLLYIEGVHDELASEYSPDVLVRVSLKESLPGKDKAYSDQALLEGGKALRVMSDDGSHFTVEGGQLATRGLFDRVVRDYLFSELPVAHLPE